MLPGFFGRLASRVAQPAEKRNFRHQYDANKT
jgi:hypothetical protein